MKNTININHCVIYAMISFNTIEEIYINVQQGGNYECSELNNYKVLLQYNCALYNKYS